MRLNKAYQKDLEDVFSVYREIFNNTDKYDGILSDINKLNEDYVPDDPREPIETWVNRLKPESIDIENKAFSVDTDKIQPLQVYKNENSLTEGDFIGFRDKNKRRLLFSPDSFLLMDPLPIHYSVRFPLPCFFETLPPYEDEGKKKKGAKMNWGLNLLAYELYHRFNLGKNDIVCLLFDVDKSSKYEIKHPKILQIKAMINRTEKSVNASYPLPPYPSRTH